MALAALAAVGVGSALAAEALPLPGSSGWAVWQAEEAEQEGAWMVGPEGAEGEQYLRPASMAEGPALVFPFEAEEPTILRVRPVWWRNGEQKLARRFPYPLVRKPGPDVVDVVGTKVFCTAPAAGRVVVVDAVSEEVVGFVEVGGYLTDLVADREAGKVYAADGLGDRVVVIDAGSETVLGALGVPGSPWSLALNGGTLYVACRDGKRVVAVDAATGQVIREAALEARPVSLELVGSPARGLVVRFEEQAFTAVSLGIAAADEEQFDGVDVSGRPPPDCGGPQCDCKWVEPAGPHRLAIVSNEGRELVDVGAVTRKSVGSGAEAGLPENPGPVSPMMMYIGEPPRKQLALFASPSSGLVGVLNLDTKKLEEPVEIGGCPVGLARDEEAGKLYVADAAGERVVVVDAAARKIESEIAVGHRPSAMAFVGEVAWQREEFVPPTEVNRLFVACREARELVILSLEEGSVVARVRLPGEPRSVKFVPMPNTGWWPVLADDRIPFALTPRVAVELMPVTLDTETLRPAASQEEASKEARRRTEATVTVGPGESEKVFSADNQLVLGVDLGTEEERWMDLSRAADPQGAGQRPLEGKEEPGTVSVSLDGGPEFDWAKGVWLAPDSKMLLANDSEEFWRYNAASFRVEAGRHVLRVRAQSESARLDAVAVRRASAPAVSVAVAPEPREVHGRVPTPTYQGVFYDEEPVRFTLEVSNRGRSRAELEVSCSLRNYMGEVVHGGPPARVDVRAGETGSYPLEFAPRDMGRFTLRVECESREAPWGSLVREVQFLRLPKLEHPRLFWRASEEEGIEARIAQYPNLFRRYGDWLERMAAREGRFPERFLPPAPTAEECAACAPEDITDAGEARNRYGWRNYEVGWRILAVQFADRFLKPGSARLKAKVEELRAAEEADKYIAYHHHGPFFPGAVASIVDLAPAQARERLKLRKRLADEYGNMDVLPWTLVTLEEPLTPEKRGLIYEVMTWENNAERYFETHRGKRGGTWWMDPYTWCHCPMHGYTLSFLLLRNFFGEPRLFEKPIFSGYLTFQHYADPIEDNREVQPNVGGPGGEPWRWIFSSLAGHPLEKRFYDWEDWVKEMAGPLAGDERGTVDKLMALEGRPLTGPMTGHANHFVSGVSVPIALALGWYDPEAAEVEAEELPPTSVFEVEGWAAMRSGWGKEATEVTFISGVREHTTRHKPNHFTIVKGGEYLIGTPALVTDDGNNVAAWGNTVVVGDEWERDWRLNLEHPRDGEHLVINRFSPATFTYMARDRRLVGYRPAEGGWGGGLNLHGHTETLFMDEGRLVAYQTWPGLDYAAGDAANAWRCEEVVRADRQLVFVKPDLVVVYDRVELGPEGKESRWIAATAPGLEIAGSAFEVKSGSEVLHGLVLLPNEAVLSQGETSEEGWLWKDQKLLEVRPAAQGKEMEYLVVMGVGEEGAAAPEAALIEGPDEVGVEVRLGDRTVEVVFDRAAPAGGSARVTNAGRTTRYELREGIVDSYAGWRADSRYQKWVSEPRFGFVVPQGDRAEQ